MPDQEPDPMLKLRRRIAALAEIDNPAEQPSDAQIDALGQRLGIAIPDGLRAYFGAIGRYRGSELMGTTTSFDKVEAMSADARELMRRYGKALPEDAIVFMSHQGVEFSFVRAGEVPEPAVYQWGEGGDIRRAHASILDLVESLFPPVE
jgi:hypothetical protein